MRRRQVDFQAIGTGWQIRVNESVEDSIWYDLQGAIHTRIDEFDAVYSRFRDDSLVSRMAAKTGTFPLPADGFKLLKFYEQLYSATDGKVTPLIGQTVTEAGYDARYSFKSRTLHRPPRWEGVIMYDKDVITVKQPVLLDFGAAGKGYLVDIVGSLISAAGIHNFLINAGGDILRQSSDADTIDVGLENPLDTSEAVGIVRLASKSLCASAGSKRKWEGFHHIIDPDTLSSPEDILAVWVLADDAMTADGIATALFFVEPQALSSRFSFSYAMLYKDMSMQHAKDFPVTVFEEAHGTNK